VQELRKKFQAHMRERKRAMEGVKSGKLRPSPTAPAKDHKWKILKGNDDAEYVSRPDKNSVFHWKKINPEPAKALDYYKQILKPEKLKVKYSAAAFLTKARAAARDLKRRKIYFYHLPWKGIGNFIDDAWNVACENVAEIHGQDSYEVMDNFSILFFTDNRVFWAERGDAVINVQHNILKKDREVIEKTFRKYFGRRVTFPKRVIRTIDVSFKNLR
jgi:hypothetical protein